MRSMHLREQVGAGQGLSSESLHTPRVWPQATAQSALGWYRPSVGVPETLDGKPSGALV